MKVGLAINRTALNILNEDARKALYMCFACTNNFIEYFEIRQTNIASPLAFMNILKKLIRLKLLKHAELRLERMAIKVELTQQGIELINEFQTKEK